MRPATLFRCCYLSDPLHLYTEVCVSDDVGLGRAAILFARTAWALMVPHAARMEVSSLTKAGCAYVCAFGRVTTDQVILQATRKKAKTKTMQKDSRCPELPALVAVLGAASTVLPGAEGLYACTCTDLDEWLYELQRAGLFCPCPEDG